MAAARQVDLLSAHCIFIGANVYCNGTTEIATFNSYCWNDGGGDWVETTTQVINNGAYCQ